MKQRSNKDHGQFHESDLYRQLLLRRRAQPIGIISVLIKYAWFGLILIPALAVQDMFFSMIAMTAVFFVPAIVSLAVLLWFLPTIFNRDMEKGILPLIFVSPVPTSDIVSSLRLFYGYQSVKILFPFILISILFIFSEVLLGLPDNALQGLSEFLKFALVWWLLLESSIAAVSLSREIALSGVILVVFVVPVLLVVFFFGTWVADFLWRGFNCDDLVQAYINSKWMLIHMNEFALATKMHSVVTNIFQGLFLLIPIWILYSGNPRLMQSRRAGRW